MRNKGWAGLVVVGLLVVGLLALPAWATLEISPSFLGMYRKTMVIEQELHTYAARYKVDPRLARAVLLQESGGNDKLVSSAGARGYFQVMPGTFRFLGVRSNIEGGIKYLAQMKQRFGREDYAVAAYNAGPGRIGGARPLPLETLQYVIGVGHYRSVLTLHEPEIARQAAAIQLTRVRKNESWETLAQQTGIPSPLLRFYNPFLAIRPLQAGAFVAHPNSPPDPLLESDNHHLYYTSRIGDSYLNLAFVLGVDLETFRRDNNLWRLQQLVPGTRLRLPLPPGSPFRTLPTTFVSTPPLRTQPLALFADAAKTGLKEKAPKKIVKKVKKDKKLKTSKPPSQRGKKMVAQVRKGKKVSRRIHQVRRGETLGTIASRYDTSVRALMHVNALRTSRIQVGVILQVPEG